MAYFLPVVQYRTFSTELKHSWLSPQHAKYNWPFVMDEIKAYYEAQFEGSKVSGSIYEPMTPIVEAAHHHRMAVLDSLPVGLLGDKTIVDFGTGSWGFACIYPRLHTCNRAIGIDISEVAVRISEEVSAQGEFAYGSRYEYHVSSGFTIPLETGSVDLFFTGECIEHVENTDAFLDEIHRVLVPNGMFILTTPNAKPVIYRALGDTYAVGPEHIALMTYGELMAYLDPRFEIVVFKGYNSSIHTHIDPSMKDKSFAMRWASAFENFPEEACGFVVMAKKRNAWVPRKCARTAYLWHDYKVVREGLWNEVRLHQNLCGLKGNLDAQLSLTFAGSTLIVLFWVHDWSGIVELVVDGSSQKIDLFEHVGGFKRVVISDLDESSLHDLVIRPTGEKNFRSHDDQVIFYSAASYSYSNK